MDTPAFKMAKSAAALVCGPIFLFRAVDVK